MIMSYNGHGDIVLVKSVSGETLAEYAYDEFGNVLAQNGELDNPYRYAGYEYLDSVDLYDLNARYYNPKTARFLSEDPYYNLGNRVIGLYEINVPSVLSVMQANALYVYCGNRPNCYYDHSGLFWETVFDLVTLGFSIVDVVKNPTDVWAWAGLAGDVADVLIPFVGGIGEVVKASRGTARLVVAANKADDVVDLYKGMKAVDRAKAIRDGAVVMSYKKLKKVAKETGLEVHHLIEQRFAKKLGIKNADDILSVALDKDVHKKITKAFRDEIGYNNQKKAKIVTKAANPQDIWDAVCKVYRDNGFEDMLPALKEFLLENADNAKDITDWLGV